VEAAEADATDARDVEAAEADAPDVEASGPDVEAAEEDATDATDVDTDAATLSGLLGADPQGRSSSLRDRMAAMVWVPVEAWASRD